MDMDILGSLKRTILKKHMGIFKWICTEEIVPNLCLWKKSSFWNIQGNFHWDNLSVLESLKNIMKERKLNDIKVSLKMPISMEKDSKP